MKDRMGHRALYHNGVYVRRKRYWWANGEVKFAGYNTRTQADLADGDWEIYKAASDGSDEEGPHTGAVDTEAGILAMAAWKT